MSQESDSQVVVVESAFLNYLKSLPQKSETTIRIFNRSEFYTVHGDDALFVAKEFFGTMNNIKKYRSGKIEQEYLVLNKNQFESCIKHFLLVLHYRIEVYSSKGGHKSNDWFLEFKGSPGNLDQFENIFVDSGLVTGSTAMAIKIGGESNNKIIGVATVETSERSMTVAQFQDQESLTEFEGFLVQVGPKEIIVPDSAEYKNVLQVVKRCGALISTRKPGEFTMEGLTSELDRILHWQDGQAPNSMALPELKHTVAASALNALIKYLELPANESNFNQFTLTVVEPNRFLHIDTSSAKALGVIPTQSSGMQYSLISFLDRCRTPQGRRLLSQWVKQPLKDIKAITERQEIVSALMDNPELRVSLSEDHLRRFPDLQLLARKLQRKHCSLQECYKIYLAVDRIQPLLDALKEAEYSAAVRDSFIDSLKDLKEDMTKFQEMISSTLDMDMISKGEYLVKVDFSEDLAELREKLKVLEDRMDEECKNAASDLGLEAGKSIKLESTPQIGYHFRATSKKEERNVRNNPQYKLIDAAKGGLRFQSKKLAEFSEDYLETKRNYDDCQRSIVEEIVNISAGYVGPILSINGVIAKLDVLTSFALTAANAPIPYVRPELKTAEEGVLKIQQARHPMLEVQETKSVIPNDIHMDSTGNTLYIITGPNMGGKSTYIRTIGVTVLLAHIGSFVPCEKAEISLRDAILARIGSGDHQLAGVSTFMYEMVETSAVLRRATNKSLVMIDELGRGTSTYEGCGIAWAIAKYLATEIKPFTLFATHFQELTLLPEEVPAAANFHVKASVGADGLTLLYQVVPGPSDRSFGLEVARMAQLGEAVIERARQKQIEIEQRQGIRTIDTDIITESIESGEKILYDFLRNVKNKDITELKNLKEEVLKHNNPHISAILA
ncbi:UNVERIFIED_CONTAM: hypothetical protein PYX00_003247 [Menopon gallinae]|uniref:DNA mismatch repair proteins mutS family domain-containing protein n=1 Tax=Menopon gallinae TaxID=328185 RepID=A0AAW2HZR3_9NEOP